MPTTEGDDDVLRGRKRAKHDTRTILNMLSIMQQPAKLVVRSECQPRNPTYRLAKPEDGAGGGVFPEEFLRKALSWDAERDIIAGFFLE